MMARLDLVGIRERAVVARTKNYLDHEGMADLFALTDEIVRLRETLRAVAAELYLMGEEPPKHVTYAIHLAEQAIERVES